MEQSKKLFEVVKKELLNKYIQIDKNVFYVDDVWGFEKPIISYFSITSKGEMDIKTKRNFNVDSQEDIKLIDKIFKDWDEARNFLVAQNL